MVKKTRNAIHTLQRISQGKNGANPHVYVYEFKETSKLEMEQAPQWCLFFVFTQIFGSKTENTNPSDCLN